MVKTFYKLSDIVIKQQVILLLFLMIKLIFILYIYNKELLNIFINIFISMNINYIPANIKITSFNLYSITIYSIMTIK